MTLIHAQTHKWSVAEYLHLAELGAFTKEERVELIEGEIISMPQQTPLHSGAILRANKVLVLALHATHDVGVQLTNVLSENSAPEPDFVVVRNGQVQPGQPLRGGDLFIEVANTSLAYDRAEKASLYAKAMIPEYWVLNVRDRCLEVRRDPRPDPEAPFGFSYGSLVTLMETATVSPLCRPDVTLRVADLL